MEYDHLYIQLELCETSLSALQQRAAEAKAAVMPGVDGSVGGEKGAGAGGVDVVVFCEKEVVKVLRHISTALACAHERRVAHLDVKPDNILVARGVYKLADWGRATPVDGVGNVSFAGGGSRGGAEVMSVEDGDSRYLAPELLRGEFHAGGGVSSARGSGGEPRRDHGSGGDGLGSVSPSPTDSNMRMCDEPPGADYVGLDRADIFSLGATAYELARGQLLPASGTEYQSLRRGRLTLLPGFSVSFQSMLASLMKEDPTARPSARALLKSGALAAPTAGVHGGVGGGRGGGEGAGAGAGGDAGAGGVTGLPRHSQHMMVNSMGPSLLGQESRRA